jgi:hypothetical protein
LSVFKDEVVTESLQRLREECREELDVLKQQVYSVYLLY